MAQYKLTNHAPKPEVKIYTDKESAILDFGSELDQCARELGFTDSSDPMFWEAIDIEQQI